MKQILNGRMHLCLLVFYAIYYLSSIPLTFHNRWTFQTIRKDVSTDERRKRRKTYVWTNRDTHWWPYLCSSDGRRYLWTLIKFIARMIQGLYCFSLIMAPTKNYSSCGSEYLYFFKLNICVSNRGKLFESKEIQSFQNIYINGIGACGNDLYFESQRRVVAKKLLLFSDNVSI